MSSEIDSKDTIDEVKDCFVGIDPDDTDTLSYKGATFTLGVIPSGVWQRLNAERALAHQGAVRRTIQVLAAAGENPDDLEWTKAKDGVDVTKAVVNASVDPLYLERLQKVIIEAARWGVRGHSDFVNGKGKPFPFTTISETYGGETWQVLSPATLRVYSSNTHLLNRIWVGLFKINQLGATGKKD